MKIYKFEFKSGEADWIFAPNKKDAIKFYQSHTGGFEIKDYEITLIPKVKWSENKIIDSDDYVGDFSNDEKFINGYRILETFEDYAKNNNTTDVIATTEF